MVRTLLGGAVVAMTAVTLAGSGVACADAGQDPGSNHNPSSRQAGKANPLKVEAQLREEAKKAKEEADQVRKALEATPEDVVMTASALGPGGPVPTMGMAGLVPNARALAAYISNTYPGVQSIGGVRSDPLPDHPSGHAIDIMIGWDMGLGDAINADVQSQAGRFGVRYTLWRVPNHFNHVHVTVF